MDIKEVQEITVELKLRAPNDYLDTLQNTPEEIEKYANGVGSKTSIAYHITPDTIWGMNVNPSSHIHDWMYAKPDIFATRGEALEHKQVTEDWFKTNLYKQIESGSWWLRTPRKLRVMWYLWILNGKNGMDAFFDNKTILNEGE